MRRDRDILESSAQERRAGDACCLLRPEDKNCVVYDAITLGLLLRLDEQARRKAKRLV